VSIKQLLTDSSIQNKPFSNKGVLLGCLSTQTHAEYRLFYRVLLQKRPVILRSLLIVATHNTHQQGSSLSFEKREREREREREGERERKRELRERDRKRKREREREREKERN